MTKNIAIVLSGCGFLDGAEIRESVLTLLALDSKKVHYEIFAPNRDQHHVVNHLTGEQTHEKRNILVETARIARGKVTGLDELDTSNFDALILPGGFGAAKNLSSFAFEGSQGSIDNHLGSIIENFYEQSKPIGAICISPALIALALGDKSPTLTIGNDQATANELNKLGAKHENSEPYDCVIDHDNKIVSTAAYMFDEAPLDDIYKGISKVVDTVIELS